MERLLIVEDDATIALGLEYSLRQEGFETQVCRDIQTSKNALQNEKFSLLLLDLALPDGSGFEICKFAKQRDDLPIIFLTANDDETSVVMGLDMGADDYITKPFRIRELISRIRTVLRRYGRKEENGIINIEGLTIHPGNAKVFKEGTEILLTALEYRLLLIFANNEARVLSRSQILEGIWDVAGEYVNDNTLTVYIKRLRDKIEDNPQEPKLLKTVRGLGYQFGG